MQNHRYPCLLITMTILFLLLHILVVGFGVDPALRISVFDELTLGEGFDGVTQVQGFHSESRAFHFQGTVTHTACVLSFNIVVILTFCLNNTG